MNKSWDGSKVTFDVATWRAVYDCLLPGAHLLAFGGTRTRHRMVCAIEDAGFQIVDEVLWLHGQGFPKNKDVSKAIDKAAGAEREVIGQIVRGDVLAAKTAGVTMAAAEANRNNAAIFGYGVEKLTAPATPEAERWAGFGTALKPSHENIIVARKPLSESSVAANVLKHGCGALNIDASRIEAADQAALDANWDRGMTTDIRGGKYVGGKPQGVPVKARPLRDATAKVTPSQFGAMGGSVAAGTTTLGRWPANVVHDGSEEVLQAFPIANSTRANGNPNDPIHGSNGSGTAMNGERSAVPRLTIEIAVLPPGSSRSANGKTTN